MDVGNNKQVQPTDFGHEFDGMDVGVMPLQWRVMLTLAMMVGTFSLGLGHGVAAPTAGDKFLKAAFVRHGNLWIRQGNSEEQVTNDGEVSYPSWSPSGQWVVYLKEQENQGHQQIWAYSLSEHKDYRLSIRGWNPRWAPYRDELACQVDEGLKVIALTSQGPSVPLVLHLKRPQDGSVPRQVQPQQAEQPLRLGNYSWLPDGSGFLLTSRASFGKQWTNAVIYQLSLDKPLFVAAPSMFAPLGVTESTPRLHQLFVIPQYVRVPSPNVGATAKNPDGIAGLARASLGTESAWPYEWVQAARPTAKPSSPALLGVTTTGFKFSPDARWIAFVLVPTASWSMDTDVLCVMRRDGHGFHPLAEVLGHNEDWFTWAPDYDQLAFIEGGGRTGFRDKRLGTAWISSKPAKLVQTWTPKGFAEGSFDWLSSVSIITSRMHEIAGFPAVSQRPLPSLYRVGLASGLPYRLFTDAPPGFGDFFPHYLAAHQLITWVRSNREHGDVWVAGRDGSRKHLWLQDIDPGSWYYEQWDWRRTLAWYEPPHK